VSTIRILVRRWIEVLNKLEQATLVFLVLIMVGLAFLQIFLRIFFSFGIMWGDVALRHLVLWVGLLGATVATRESKHIHIDILPRLLTGKGRLLLGILLDLVSAFVCLLLAFAGFKFVSDEFMMKTTSFLQIPGWIVTVIFPLAFSVIAIQFGLNGLRKILGVKESDS
jgi:TRAP-type C4-dicarboxylate transport system permease small subunit